MNGYGIENKEGREIEISNKESGNIRKRIPDYFNPQDGIEYAFCKIGGSRATVRRITCYVRNAGDRYWTLCK